MTGCIRGLQGEENGYDEESMYQHTNSDAGS